MKLQHKVWVRIGLMRMLVAYQGMICNDKDYTLYRIPSEIRCGKKQAERVVVKVGKKNLKQYRSEAASLEVISYRCAVNQNFFEAKTFIRTRTLQTLSERS